ncbi:flavin reductase family protein [Microbacterium binotii]|jgi:flavin reductase (DIM6/NTAB) family NADH-FMN oxidoreductase RutF|uniref:Flavin reductase family protein n=1 Tax=Microbacterium binotii TaxID=462710 RepID=A0ABP6BQZ4_9MICO
MVQTQLPSTHLTITPKVLYFGTPVVVISSLNPDGTTNLAPVSSYWALGDLLVIGLGSTGQTVGNIRRNGELVVNLCDETHWRAVESLALLTGASPVPADKPAGCRFEPDKFAVAGWSRLASTTTTPERILEAGAHIEARATALHEEEGGYVVVHARATAVHAAPEMVVAGTSHINPSIWRPLIYSFRHYFGLGPRRGIAARADLQH